MLHIHYHSLGILSFCIGLILTIQLPGDPHLLGEFFLTPTIPLLNGNFPLLQVVASLFRIIGIILYVKWLADEQKETELKIFKKFELPILAFLLFAVPALVHSTVDTTARTFQYSGASSKDSVEYIQTKSSCRSSISKHHRIANCTVTLKNYQHNSQRIAILLSWQNNDKKEMIYLLRRQEKEVSIRFPIKNQKQNIQLSPPEITFLSLMK